MAQVTLKNVSTISAKAGSARDGGALQDFSLEVRDREFMALVGPEGCGNSTALRLIAGLDKASSGEILIVNRAMTNMPPVKRDLAMVFRQGGLFPNWTVSANIAFGLKGRHFPKAEIGKRIREAANVAGVREECLEYKPEKLTVTDRLRVALARAMVGQPKVILVDNPLSSLGANEQAGMRAELVKLQERLQTTMIYATCDPLEAMALGQRIAVMKSGALLQCDTPLAIYEKPANLFVAGFLGQPKMNLLVGRLRSAPEGVLFKESDGVVELKFANRTEWKELVGKEVVLGIRPEDVQPLLASESKARAGCQGIVDYAESTGAEAFYAVQTGAHTLIIRSSANGELAGIGRRMLFDINPERAHLFDKETGTRIS